MKRLHDSEPTHGACWFCQQPLKAGERRRYIYPIPQWPDRPVLSARHGAFACAKCEPAVRQEQRAQGLLKDAQVAGWIEAGIKADRKASR